MPLVPAMVLTGAKAFGAPKSKLRITRVKALNNQDVVAVLTCLLARYPDTFPAMLDDALSSVSPNQGGG